MKTVPIIRAIVTIPADAATRERSGKRRAARGVVDLAADVRTLAQDGEDTLLVRDQALRVLAATVAALRSGWSTPDLYAVALLTRLGLMPAPGSDPHDVLVGLARPTVADLARLYPQNRHERGLRREELLEVCLEAPGRARRMVLGAVADWCLLGLADDAITIVSELVTNAVRHANSRTVSVAVTLQADGKALVIEVGDEDPVQPCARPLPTKDAVGDPGTDAGEGGAGLIIVLALAHEVEMRQTAAGKIIAATLLVGGAR